MGSRAARLPRVASGQARLCRNSRTFQRDGRAAGDGQAGNARPGEPCGGRYAGGAVRALCRRQPSRGGMIERLSAVAGRDVSRETFERLTAYAALVREEAKHQNLVSASTLEHLWERHILDSAQLVRFEPHASASW